VSGRQMLTGRSLCASRTMKVKGLAMRPTPLGARSVAMRSIVGVRASGSERAGSGAPGVEPSLREHEQVHGSARARPSASLNAKRTSDLILGSEATLDTDRLALTAAASTCAMPPQPRRVVVLLVVREREA
jgi:hypothetical protein